MVLVYSTDQGKIPQKEGKPNGLANTPNDGVIRIMFSAKGRKGSGATIISGINVEILAELQLTEKALLKKLKQACSSGGAVKDGSFEVQGEHRDKIKQLLEKHIADKSTNKSLVVKLAGGVKK